MSRISKSIQTGSRFVVTRGFGEAVVGTDYSSGDGGFLRVMKMFWNQTVVMFIQHCVRTKCHWTVHFKMTQMVIFMCIIPL